MNINTVIDLHRYAYKNKNIFKIFILLFYSIFSLLFKRYKLNSSNSLTGNYKILFYKSLHRTDYDKLFDNIVQTCDAKKIVVQSRVVYGLDLTFLINCKNDLRYFKKISANSILEKTYLFFSYLFYKKMLNQLKDINFDCLVSFADMQPVENLVTQYFRNKNKKTITLQHGLFLEHGWNANLNEVNYKNIVSDYFLTWGGENKKLIRKYNNDVNIIICGNPQINTIEKNMNPPTVKFFTVMFDSNLWHEYNQRMLNIANEVAKKMGLKINIRFHPANKIEDYDIDNAFIIDNNSINYHDSEFILGHTSSMIHVCMRQGLVVFKMTSDMPHSYINPKFHFKDSKDILKKIKNLNDFREIDYNHIEYISTESLEQYKLFFRDLSLESCHIIDNKESLSEK